jgi:hypothetical protein
MDGASLDRDVERDSAGIMADYRNKSEDGRKKVLIVGAGAAG